MKIAVFVSGRGSNLKAIISSAELKNLVEVKAVFSDKPDCPAFKVSSEQGIPSYSLGNMDGCIRYAELAGFLKSLEVDLVVLAGFLKLIPSEVVKNFRHKIINIHPALLPSFGGKGMYGINVHKAVFKTSAKVSGATVHFVDETYDTGTIIAQRCVDISGVKTPEDIAEKVLRVEHEILPLVIKKIALGKVEIVENRVIVK